MRPPVRPSVLALSLWTLLVWGVRVRNAAGEVGPTILALVFVALAVATLATRGARPAVLALAGWTVAVWVVRVVDIVALSDHDAAFKVVHGVLAAVSVGLAAWAARPLVPSTAARPA